MDQSTDTCIAVRSYKDSLNAPEKLPSSLFSTADENGKRSEPSNTLPFLMNEDVNSSSDDIPSISIVNSHRVSNGKSMVIVFPTNNTNEVNVQSGSSDSFNVLRSSSSNDRKDTVSVPYDYDKSTVSHMVDPSSSSQMPQDTDPLPLAAHLTKDFTSTSFTDYHRALSSREEEKNISLSKLQRFRSTSHVSFTDVPDDELPTVPESTVDSMKSDTEYRTSHYLLSVFLLLFLWSSWTIVTIVLGVDTVYFHSYTDNSVCNQYSLLPWIRAYTVTATISLCSIVLCFMMGFVVYPCYKYCSGSNSNHSTDRTNINNGNYFLPTWLWIPIATFAALFLQLILGTVLLSLTMERNDSTCVSSLLYQDSIYIIATSWPLSVLTFIVLVLYLYAYGRSSSTHYQENSGQRLKHAARSNNKDPLYGKPRSFSTNDAYERQRKINDSPYVRSSLPPDWPSFLSPPRYPQTTTEALTSIPIPSKAPLNARPRASSSRTHFGKWGNRVRTGVDENGQRIHTPPPMFSPFAKGTDPDLTSTASTNSVTFASSKLFQTLSFLLHRHSSKTTMRSDTTNHDSTPTINNGSSSSTKNTTYRLSMYHNNNVSELSDITGIDYESVDETSQASSSVSVRKSNPSIHRKSVSVVTGDTYISIPDHDHHGSTVSSTSSSTSSSEEQDTQSTSSNSDHEANRSLTGSSQRTRSLSTASSVHSAVAAIATVTIAGIHHAIRVSSTTVQAAFTSPTSVPTHNPSPNTTTTSTGKRSSVTETIMNPSSFARIMGTAKSAKRRASLLASSSSGLTSGGDFIGLQLMMDDNDTTVIDETMYGPSLTVTNGYHHTMDENYTVTTPSGDTYPTLPDDQSDIHITMDHDDEHRDDSRSRNRTVSCTSTL